MRSKPVFVKRKGGPGRGKKKPVNSVESPICSNNVSFSADSVEDSELASTSTEHVTVNATRRKLVNNFSVYNDSDEINDPEDRVTSGNHIINLSLLSCALSSFMKCKYCDANGSIVCVENSKKRAGIAAKLILECTSCGVQHSFCTSENTDHGFENNIRFVYGLRSIGKGAAAGKTLCSILNMPKPPTKFIKFNTILNKATKECASKSMTEAVKEAVDQNDGSVDIAVALDGTWQKRGHTSLNGVESTTSVDTGKVIDVEILTKYCQTCENLKNCTVELQAHKTSGICKANFTGVSGGMEAVGAVAIFQRSIENYGVRYVKYLGDGDSKGFKKVTESKPYGTATIRS